MSSFQETFRALRKEFGDLPTLRALYQHAVEHNAIDQAMVFQHTIRLIELAGPSGSPGWNGRMRLAFKEAALFADQVDRTARAPGN